MSESCFTFFFTTLLNKNAHFLEYIQFTQSVQSTNALGNLFPLGLTEFTSKKASRCGFILVFIRRSNTADFPQTGKIHPNIVIFFIALVTVIEHPDSFFSLWAQDDAHTFSILFSILSNVGVIFKNRFQHFHPGLFSTSYFFPLDFVFTGCHFHPAETCLNCIFLNTVLVNQFTGILAHSWISMKESKD